MVSLFDPVQQAAYEHPAVIAMGPVWSAVTAGFAVIIAGQPHITPAGERYLASLPIEEEA
jgi:hypothetical protein